jgi:hypothetical protein
MGARNGKLGDVKGLEIPAPYPDFWNALEPSP